MASPASPTSTWRCGSVPATRWARSRWQIFVGLDTLAKIGDIMFEEYHEKRYAAPPLLRRMVLAGLNGRKSGHGFYDYTVDPPVASALGL